MHTQIHGDKNEISIRREPVKAVIEISFKKSEVCQHRHNAKNRHREGKI